MLKNKMSNFLDGLAKVVFIVVGGAVNFIVSIIVLLACILVLLLCTPGGWLVIMGIIICIK